MERFIKYLIGYKDITLRQDVDLPTRKDGFLLLRLFLPAAIISYLLDSLFFTALSGIGVIIGLMILGKILYRADG
jgi:hypothetical protein